MRVDMRRWILVCLSSILAAGGGCSARALLTIELDGPGALEGWPEIAVSRPDGETHIVKKPNYQLDGGQTSIGLYLDFEGSVDVVVTIHRTACDWKGSSAKPADIHRGARTDVTIHLEIDCRPQADGGAPDADGGAPDADGAAPEVAPTLIADAGRDAHDAPGEASFAGCIEYCTRYLAACVPGASSFDRTNCLTACSHWPLGTPDAATGEDSLACRLTHLDALKDPALACSECPAASPESPGICSAQPDGSAARDACPIDRGEIDASPGR
jgi:hypothetical protein